MSESVFKYDSWSKQNGLGYIEQLQTKQKTQGCE